MDHGSRIGANGEPRAGANVIAGWLARLDDSGISFAEMKDKGFWMF